MQLKFPTIACLAALLTFTDGRNITKDFVNPVANLSDTAHSLPNGSSANPVLHRTDKRWDPPAPASEEQWEHAMCKGAQLLEDMLGTDRDAGRNFKPPRESAQSPWTDPISECLPFDGLERLRELFESSK